MSTLQQHAERYFEECLDVRMENLLAPISDIAPAGSSLRHTRTYSALREARREDDASSPLSGWEHELKRADWNEVSRIIVQALQFESKDLQLLAWLLEAQIRLYGVAGISATLVLTRAMCLRYWDSLHPEIIDGDVEHRVNLLNSIAQKNLPPIRLAPLIRLDNEQTYNWSDWEIAHRNEQIKNSPDHKDHREHEGPTLQLLQSAINGTSTDSFIALNAHLLAALQAIDELSTAIDSLLDEHAPSMNSMKELLSQMNMMIENELHKRGVRTAMPENTSGHAAEHIAAPDITHAATKTPAHDAYNTTGGIRDRADAYARLSEAAEFLMRVEPHSPVPYLVRRATEWGHLNTVELYQELFLRLGGQLNIFEMLGLDQNTGTAK